MELTPYHTFDLWQANRRPFKIPSGSLALIPSAHGIYWDRWWEIQLKIENLSQQKNELLWFISCVSVVTMSWPLVISQSHKIEITSTDFLTPGTLNNPYKIHFKMKPLKISFAQGFSPTISHKHLELFNCCEIWQASWQQGCRGIWSVKSQINIWCRWVSARKT